MILVPLTHRRTPSSLVVELPAAPTSAPVTVIHEEGGGGAISWLALAGLAGALTLGERKKLELARALATRPKVLLLDEVMAGVQRGEVDDLMDVLERIHKDGTTILMIEHLVHVIVRLAQHVVVLNFGEKLFEGEPAAVLEHPAVRESYLGKPLAVA